MVLSQREKYIAIGLGAALGLLVLDRLFFTPLSDWDVKLLDDRSSADAAVAKESRLFNRQHALMKVWREINTPALKSEPAEAQSQLQNALVTWAQESGLQPTGFHPEVLAEKNGFVESVIQAGFKGTTSTLADFLWRVESSQIPVRIDEMQISSHTEGVDELQVQMKISTISKVPDANGVRTSVASANVAEVP